jgi:hypothetical protein
VSFFHIFGFLSCFYPGSYFEYVLVSFGFNDVSILVGSPDRLNFDENKAYLDLLTLVSLDFDHLIVLEKFNFDILLDPELSATSRYPDILVSLSILFFPVQPVVTRPTSGTCIDQILTKFPEKVILLVLGFLPLWRIILFLAFSYCIRPLPPVDAFVS